MSSKKSLSHGRRISAFLSPKLYTLVVEYARKHEVSESEAVGECVRFYFDSISPEARERNTIISGLLSGRS